MKSQDSSVDTVTKLQVGWSRTWFLASERNFYLLQNVQSGSETEPVSSSMGNRGSLPGSKAMSVWSGVVPLLHLYAFTVCTRTHKGCYQHWTVRFKFKRPMTSYFWTWSGCSVVNWLLLLHYYYYYYYYSLLLLFIIHYHLYAGYIQLYTWKTHVSRVYNFAAIL